MKELNYSLVYPKVNNGVYRSGFARRYEVFEALEIVEEKLGKQRYLGGDRFTWLDLRLFNTMVRFDPVYVTYFINKQEKDYGLSKSPWLCEGCVCHGQLEEVNQYGPH